MDNGSARKNAGFGGSGSVYTRRLASHVEAFARRGGRLAQVFRSGFSVFVFFQKVVVVVLMLLASLAASVPRLTHGMSALISSPLL